LAHGLEVIARNTKLQARLIEDLLDVSRAIAGKVDLDVRPVLLGPIVEAALDGVRPAADTKRIHLQAALDMSVGFVSGDRDRLGQIVSNLLTNAVKFTPPGGRVDVRLRRVGSQAEIIVSDTGAGIAAEFLPHLFERFHQSQVRATTIGQRGLGLGLALVKHLTELHGGTVRAESAGVDQGSRFTVILPVRDDVRGDAATAPAVTPSKLDRPDDLEGVRILLVEDHPDTRELLTIALQARGANVTAVSSAAETLKALQRIQPHVIVSDIGLNGDDGYELMRQIRVFEAGRGDTTPAVAVTALSGAEDRRRALAAGYQHHLAKPVDAAELARVVAQLVRRRPAA
jgi:CheY-like chemotaxis protein